MRKFYLLIVALIITGASYAQLSGNYNIPGAYGTIAAAIADLNVQGVGPSGATFNVTAGHTETFLTPTAGTITKSGSLAGPIVFQKSGSGANPLITAGVGTGTADGIIKLAGGDYITFDGIDVVENAANTTATTQMEWGYALVNCRATAPFDGCQNVTIKNCAITLNKVNTASVGIYSGNHIATATTSLTITVATDAMNNCKFFSNTISNVYAGIKLNGFAASSPYTLYDQGNEIGKDGANNITNFGGGSSTVYGIYALYQNGLKVANNAINGGTGTTTTLYGIFLSTGTSSNVDIFGNTVTIAGGGTTSSIYGINNAMGSTAASNTVNIYNNTVQNCTYTTATSGGFYGILCSATCAITNIYGNTVASNVLPGTGDFYGINPSASNGTNVVNVYSNTINGNQKTGTGGTFYGIRGNTATNNVYLNNIFSNSVTGGSGGVYGIYNGSSPVAENYYNNNVYDLTQGGTGTVYGIQISTAAGLKNTYGNNIYNLTAVGGTVYGIGTGYGTPHNIYKNKIYNLTGGGVGIVYGINITGGTTMYLYNNFVSDLKNPASTALNAIIGINISGGTAVAAYYNTVFLNATSTSATTFGTTGLYKASTTTCDFRNNVVVNLSTPSGTGGMTVAYRWSGVFNPVYYSSLSNNNNFYAGAPGATRLIFYDGTNSDQTMASFQTRVSPMENLSFSENSPFVNVATAPYDLHMSTTTATYCMAGGTAIAAPIVIGDDYDGNTRAAIPCVGADEFAGVVAGIANPTGVTAAVISSRQINLGFTPNVSANNVVIVYNLTGAFSTPTGTPVVGTTLAGDTVLYVGTTSPFNHTNLTGGTKYYYKMYSYDGTVYSLGVPVSATTGVAPPTAFTATPFGSTQINLGWTRNAQSNDVVIAHNTTNTFGTPVNGTALTIGAGLTGGGTIIYIGPLTSFSHTGLTAVAQYYKAWSVDAFSYYSATAVTANATPAVPPPTAFTATATSSTQINLGWTLNAAGHNVIVATNSTATFGVPVNGTAYTAGNAITGGGTVLYVGPLALFNHTGLTPQTAYYYKIWSLDAVNYYSTGATANATTLCNTVTTFPFTEGFEGATFPPSCWLNTSWVSSLYGGANTGTKWAYSNLSGSILTTPALTLTGGNYRLIYYYRTESSSYPQNFDVLLSTNGTTYPITLSHVVGAINATYLQVIIDLSAYTGQTVNIRFNGLSGTGGYDYGICIDDVTVELIPSVLSPTAFTATPYSSQRIDLSFTPNAAANNVVIVYNATGTFTDPTGAPVVGNPLAGGTVLSVGTTVPVAHSGLTFGTAVYYKAFSYDGTLYSPGVTANAIPSVPPPTSLVATPVSFKLIDLTWVKNTSNHDVMIATNSTSTFGTPINGTAYPANTALPTAGTVIYVGPLSAFSHSGLTQGTTYYYKAWSVDEFTYYSGTAPTASATTICGVAPLPYMQAFDGTSFPPSCWSQSKGLLASPVTLTGTTSSWIQDDWRNVITGDKAAKLNIWSTTYNDWLFTPQFDLGTGTVAYQLEFDLTLNAYGTSTAPGTTGTDDKFAIVISTDGGTTWTAANTLRLYDNAGSTFVYNNISPNGEHIILPLTGYTGIVKIGFYGESTVANADNDLMINNLFVQAPPTCLIPTQVAVSNPTNNSVRVEWRDAPTVQIDYGTPGHVAGAGTIVSGVTSSPYTLGGLTANTTYDVYVRQDCGAGDYSYWVGPRTFTTLCDPVVAPYEQHFPTTTKPACWSISGPQNWLFTTTWVGFGATGIGDHTTGGGGSFAGVDGSGSASLTGITLISPLIDVSALTVPQLRFFLFNNNTNSGIVDWQSLQIDLWDGASWNTNIYKWDGTMNNAAWQEIKVILSAYTITGPIQLKFIVDKSAGNPFYDDMIIDDIYIEEGPACPPPALLAANNIAAYSADLNWVETGSATSWNIEFGPAGFAPSGIPTNPAVTKPFAKTGLLSGTSYSYYVQSICGGSTSAWSGPKTFTTLVTCPPPTTLSAANITTTTADLNWTEAGTATLWHIELGLLGFTPTGVPTQSNITAKPYTYAGLSPSATYSYYVQADCGGGDKSPWAGPFTFSTACGIVTSIDEGFNGTTFPPACWTLYNNGLGNSWTRSTSNMYEGAGVMSYLYNSANAADAWAFTPQVSLTAGTTYVISFYQKNYSSTFPEKLKVTVGNSATVAGQTTILWDNDGGTSLINTTYIQRVIEYTAPSTGPVYFAFNCYSDADMWNVYVDKVKIMVKPPIDLSLTSFSQTSGTSAPVSGNNNPYEVTLNKQTLISGKQFTTALDGEAAFEQATDVNNTVVLPNEQSSSAVSDFPGTSINLSAQISNLGTSSSAYTFDWSVGGTAQPTYTGPTIPVAGSDIALLTYNPTARGTFITNGTVNATGDGDLLNNSKSFRMRVYPDVFTRTGYDNGSNVVDTYVGWNSLSLSMKSGVRFTAATNTKLAGVDFIFRTEAVTSGTIFVQVRAAGATTGAPGAVLYTKSYNTADYLPSGDIGDYITFPFGDDAPIIAAGSDYWITVKAPVGILYPGAAQSTGAITVGRSFFQQTADTTTWTPLILSAVEYAWIMRSVEVTPPVCQVPTALTATAITTNAASLDWTESGTATTWNLEYGPAGYAHGSGTVVSGITTKPYLLSGLAANTAYEFYVKADCGYSTSEWSAAKQFTTLCGTEALPYTQNFDGVTVPSIPSCWNVFASSDSTWKSYNPASSEGGVTPKSAPNFVGVFYDADGVSPKNEWLVTPGFQLVGGTSYHVKFWVKAPGYDGTPEKLKLVATSDPSLTGVVAGTVLWDQNNLTVSDYTEFISNSFTPATSGTFYFAWHAYSDAYVNYIAIDDVTIEELPPCGIPAGAPASLITTTTATISWTAPSPAPGSGYEYEVRISGAAGSGPSGRTVTGTTPAGITTAAITGLTQQTQYHVYVRSNCGDNIYSDWSSDSPFTTLAGVPENNNVNNVTVGSGQTPCYDATNTITVSNFVVQNLGSATFIAGMKISFLPGTVVQSGGYMLGKIAPSGPFCSTAKIAEVVAGTEEVPFATDRAFFTLYPNPTNGNFTLVKKGDLNYGSVKVEVFSMSGEKVFTGNMVGQKHEFQFSRMASGLYFVKVVADNYVETIKLVKTR